MIEVKDLYKNFGELKVLKGINTHIKPKEVVSVIGPSGSGKSTFLRCLNLLEEVTKGDVLIEGISLTDKKTNINALRSEVGMVFQQFNLFPHMTVIENIMLAPTMVKQTSKREAQQLGKQLLEKVGLADKANVYPDTLSGGQKQRVAIARAIVNEPSIILADEPTGALDTKTGAQIMELFTLLNKEGTTVIIVTHESEIAAYTNRTVYVRDGELTGGERVARDVEGSEA